MLVLTEPRGGQEPEAAIDLLDLQLSSPLADVEVEVDCPRACEPEQQLDPVLLLQLEAAAAPAA